jgi:hypothetical protein
LKLSLADLERFDPRAPGGHRRERRFCCPSCGTEKPFDQAHRSLAVNTATGLYFCHRCELEGKLEEWFEDRPAETKAQRARAQAAAAFTGRRSAPTSTKPAPADEGGFDWRAAWSVADEIEPSTPGADYLSGRGIAADLAQACGVKFSARWYGRPGVLFGVRDRAGDLVAVQGRLIDGGDPKALTAGPKSEGVFSALNAIESPVCAIVEGPVDALALAAAGLPAVALLGTSAPAWLAKALHSKHVLLATDADQVGDDCAGRLAAEISTPRILRLRPQSAKDWAEVLEGLGGDRLTVALRGFALDPTSSVKVGEIEGVDPLTGDDIRAAAARQLASLRRFDEALFVARMIDDFELALIVERQVKRRQNEAIKAKIA